MIVITGLDPVIHALPEANEAASGKWMAGTSPAMTVSGSLGCIWCAKVAFKFELGGRWSTPIIIGKRYR
jgi:hypothetical protein